MRFYWGDWDLREIKEHGLIELMWKWKRNVVFCNGVNQFIGWHFDCTRTPLLWHARVCTIKSLWADSALRVAAVWILLFVDQRRATASIDFGGGVGPITDRRPGSQWKPGWHARRRFHARLLCTDLTYWRPQRVVPSLKPLETWKEFEGLSPANN